MYWMELKLVNQQEQMLYLEKNMDTLLWELIRTDSELWKAPPDPLLEKISQLVTTEAPLWEGTATTLAKLLDCNLTPNVLSRKLNINAARLKEEYNIRYERSHGHESRTIKLTLCDG